MHLNTPQSYRKPLVINVLDLLVSTTSLALESAQIERKELFANNKLLADINKEIEMLGIISSQAQVLLTIIK